MQSKTGTAVVGRQVARGPVAVSRAFAPVLGANGGGALINMLSGLAWFTLPTTGGYASAKAAMWAATNSLRQNLLAQATLVTAVYVGYVDTDMAAWVDAPKMAPDVVVAAALDAVEAGEYEVLVDEFARHVRTGLSGPLTDLYPALATPVGSR